MNFLRIIILLVLIVPCAQGQSNGSSIELNYCIDPNWMPYEGIQNGTHVGISKDYLLFIGDRTGIAFNLVKTTSWTESLEFVQTGQCDALPLINPTQSRRQFLDFSLAYFEAPNVLITRRDDIAIPGFSAIGQRALGVVENYRHVEYLSRYYSNIQLYPVKSEQEGLILLAEGKIDVMLGSLLSATATINNFNLDNLVISGYAELHDALALGLAKKHAALLPAINDAIMAIPENKKVEVYKRWYQARAVSYKDSSWLVPLLVTTVVLLAIIGWVRFNQLKIKKELVRRDQELELLQSALIERNRTVEFLSTHDDLTELNNRNFMLQKVDEEISRFHRFRSPVTLLLVYADNLQRKIASHGQDAADKIMKRLAEISLERTREVDICARWSNDEILILCPQTTLLSAQILAERILTEVELQSLQVFDGIKVSVGAASLHENEDFAAWFDRTNLAVRTAQKQISHGYAVAQG